MGFIKSIYTVSRSFTLANFSKRILIYVFEVSTLNTYIYFNNFSSEAGDLQPFGQRGCLGDGRESRDRRSNAFSLEQSRILESKREPEKQGDLAFRCRNIPSTSCVRNCLVFFSLFSSIHNPPSPSLPFFQPK